MRDAGLLSHFPLVKRNGTADKHRYTQIIKELRDITTQPEDEYSISHQLLKINVHLRSSAVCIPLSLNQSVQKTTAAGFPTAVEHQK